MKIAIVGAGIGGLAAARLLARGGAQVTVFERADGVESMRYDWHDDVDPNVFAECGLPVPAGSFPKKDWTFIASNGGARSMHEERPDVSVMRRELNRLLVDEARAAGAEVRFSSCVSELLLSGGRVVGVVADGREVSADLVVDSSGVDSPLKKALGGLVSGHEKDEVFRVFRAFYARAENSKAKYSNKVYLKHLGEAGISWVIEDGGETDVLIGRVGELSEPCLARALTERKGQNPIIGEELVRGGGRYVIPVRYPATRMAADGYVLIGDSAFMTIPMLGSGIACSLNAANMLTDACKTDLNFVKFINLFERNTGVFLIKIEIILRRQNKVAVRSLFAHGGKVVRKPILTDNAAVERQLQGACHAPAQPPHTGNKNNPHGVTKAQIGLGNCDNTSDINKPISTATQNALNAKAPLNIPVNVISTKSGTISLADNSINRIAPTRTVTFSLPSVSNHNIFHQILVQITLSSAITINLGTSVYFGGEKPTFETGKYNIVYEHNGTSWTVGAVKTA